MNAPAKFDSDFQNKLHNRAAYVIAVASGYVTRKHLKGTLSSGGLVTFSARADAEDHILDMIIFGGAWTKARVVALG